MAQVPVRQPRFLGEKVPYREQSVKEQIEQSLGSGYTVEQMDGNYIAKAKPVQYVAERRGANRTYSTYVPRELLIGPQGQVLKETSRGIYKEDVFKSGQRQAVYNREITDYEKQTRFTFGKRDLKSGRETIRQTSSLVGGVYKEKRIIDQDSAEYDRLKRTDEQRRLIREKGFTVRQTQEYAVAGLSKEQRRDYYRLQAQQRSAQLSLEAKASKIARQETAEFRSELSAESQKYAGDIFAKQESQRQKAPVLERPTTVNTTSPQFSATAGITPQNYASPTTKTDMGDKLPTFFLGGKLPPGELQVAPKPKGVIERYNRLQDYLSQKQARADAQGKAGETVALGAAQFGLGVPIGAYNFAKAIAPWNLPDTVGNFFNPESYTVLGEQLRTQPAKTSGEIAGSFVASYGLGKGVQYAKTKITPKTQPTGESGVSTGGKPSKDFVQTKLSTKGERFTGQLKPQEVKFAKTKTGKGQIESTVFSAKVVKDPATGKYVRTQEIGIVRYEIPGDPTRLGTIYQTKNYAYTGKPIRVRPEVQQTLTKPQVVATSKWLPGDVRPVVIKNVRGQPTPYIPDWTGGTLRPYRPGEFTLSTVYPGKPGLQPSQASAVGFNKLSYSSTYQTPYGPVTVRKPPTAGTQTQLPTPKPTVITIVKKPGVTVKPLEGSVVTKTSPRVGTGGGSQVVTTVAPQKYAPASTVLEGTLKAYPKTKVSGAAEPVAKFDIPEGSPVPKTSVPVRQSYAGVGVAGILKTPQKQEPVTIQSPQISQVYQPSIKSEPVVRVDVTPESLAKYKDEAIAIPDSSQVPLSKPISISQPILQSETVTETRTETVLRTEPIFEPVTELTPKTITTKPSIPLDDVPLPKPILPRPDAEERKKGGQYKVQVRQKGLFKDFAITTTPEEAFRVGAKKVIGDSSASFKVLPIGGGESVSSIGRGILPKNIFYESKREPGVFIERRQFRIDKPGEKREITFKALTKIKVRRIFGKTRRR